MQGKLTLRRGPSPEFQARMSKATIIILLSILFFRLVFITAPKVNVEKVKPIAKLGSKLGSASLTKSTPALAPGAAIMAHELDLNVKSYKSKNIPPLPLPTNSPHLSKISSIISSTSPVLADGKSSNHTLNRVLKAQTAGESSLTMKQNLNTTLLSNTSNTTATPGNLLLGASDRDTIARKATPTKATTIETPHVQHKDATLNELDHESATLPLPDVGPMEGIDTPKSDGSHMDLRNEDDITTGTSQIVTSMSSSETGNGESNAS